MTPHNVKIALEREGVDRDCDACTDRMVAALRTHAGVLSVDQVGKATVEVTYDTDECSPGCIDEALGTVAHELNERYAHETVRVGGMDCTSCAQTIERAVGRIDGVTACHVNFQGSSLQVEYDRSRPASSDLTRRRVVSLGFDLPDSKVGELDKSLFARRRHEIITLVSGALTLVALAVWALGGPSWLEYASYTAAIVIGGTAIARSGVTALIATRRPDMKLLMTIAVIGAVAIGAWLEAALVVVLFSIGEALESYAVGRARSSLASLIEMVPSFARVQRTAADGIIEEQVPIAELAIGDVAVVFPGEQIPADGTIREGASAVNQASITGESVPVDKEPGEDVFAGTLNGEARLLIDVTSQPGDTTLDRIARAVADAQAQKAPSERWVDTFAAIYTPAVMAIAFAVMVIPILAFESDPSTWIYRGLAFLILSCPCALVISTPVAIVSALARASAAGVLIKGGQHLEAAASVRNVCLDKTGTITAGRPKVATVVSANGQSDEEIIALAASVESGSEHPLAIAIVEYAKAAQIGLGKTEDVEASRGYGVTGTVDGRRILVGSERFFADHPDAATASTLATPLAEGGHTIVLVADEVAIIGAIGLQDTPRDTSREAIGALHAAGVKNIALLTGDHQAAATAIANSVGIDSVHAELLPQQKVERLTNIESEHGATAMVGDGVNDAPALARATVGVAMGTGGSATAIETADIALIGDDLRKLAGTIGLARWSRSVVQQNIGFSLGTKVIAAVFALVGMLALWMAVLVDVGATLIVVANGLRLLRSSPTVGRLRNAPMLPAREAQAAQVPATHTDEGCCSGHEHDAHGSHDHQHGSHSDHDHEHDHADSKSDDSKPSAHKHTGCCDHC